jgi:ribulose-phosphate 3-epimerase
MPKIVPAILESTKEGFLDKLSKVLKIPGVERIHVDFGDSTFIPHNLLSVTEIDSLSPAYMWEAHIMAKDPNDFLDYKISGFRTVIIHYEAFESIEKIKQTIQNMRAEGLEPGISINPDTEVSVLQPLCDDVKYFQIMSVQPGAQGQEFIEGSLKKIATLRKICPNAILEVDGGINETNIKKVAEAGADLIIAGSALTKAPDILVAYERLEKAING